MNGMTENDRYDKALKGVARILMAFHATPVTTTRRALITLLGQEPEIVWNDRSDDGKHYAA
jgi:hypothetical protein